MSTRFSLLKNSAFLADKLILQTFLSIISSRSRISICDVFMKLAKKDLVNFLLNVNHFPPPPTEQLHRGGICLLQNAPANQKNIQSRPYLPLCSFLLSALSLGQVECLPRTPRHIREECSKIVKNMKLLDITLKLLDITLKLLDTRLQCIHVVRVAVFVKICTFP